MLQCWQNHCPPPIKCCYYSVGRQSTKFVLPVPSWSTLSNPLRPPLLPPLLPLIVPLPDDASKGTDDDVPKDVVKDEEVTRPSLPALLPCCCCGCDCCCCCPLATLRWREWRRSDSCWNCCSSCCVRRIFWFLLKEIILTKKFEVQTIILKKVILIVSKVYGSKRRF